MEFERVTPELPDIIINTSAAKDHVAELELWIHVIKECCQGTMATLPFKSLPNKSLIHLFIHLCFCPNAMPVK